MLNALSVASPDSDPAGVERASASMRRQGFEHALRFEWEGGALEAWAHPSQAGVQNVELRTPAGAAFCVGPLWYRGRFGRAALPLLMADVDTSSGIDEMQLRGNFALFIKTCVHCFVMNDALGLVRINSSSDRLFHSTSWLATCAYAGAVEIDEAAAIEYVLLGASHSDDTVARGVTTLPLASLLDLAGGRVRKRLPPEFWRAAGTPVSFDEAAERLRAHLLTVFRESAAACSGRIRAALSGGFDSRLILAGMLAAGTRPDLFVYGAADSSDVRIAQAVAASVGLPITAIDKRDVERQCPEVDFDRLVQAALFFDGLPNDGIWDRGADRQTRLAQTADGFLVLNGGGGEIFRNFFHLPDRSLHAIDVVRSFYRGFDARVFRHPGALGAYNERMVASIERVLGVDHAQSHRRLIRDQVELLYPLFRCHHWMGVNNSVAVRHGAYATPLMDLVTVCGTSRLPLAWKNAGRLESCLIASLHANVAAQLSTHGFAFAKGPGRRARWSGQMHRLRPPWTRPYINGAHRWLDDKRAGSSVIAHVRGLLPGAWRLDPVLDLGRLPDAGAVARAVSLEVTWRGLMQ